MEKGTLAAAVQWLWGVPTLALLVGAGVWLLLRTRGYVLLHPRTILRCTLFARGAKKGQSKELTPFRALCTALASTIGTGNLAGVAAALVVGGPGAIFWMWMFALLGMTLHAIEVVQCVAFRRKNSDGEWRGGAMAVLRYGLARTRLCRLARPLSGAFCVFCILASFGIGNTVQANTMAVVAQSSFGVPPIATGLVLAAALGAVMLGGAQRIGAVAVRLVPLMAGLYLVGAGAMICLWAQYSLPALRAIVQNAFFPQAAAGAGAGMLLRRAVAVGARRGVFSNEAGLGSSGIAHAAAQGAQPRTQGMWGVLEVFFDTMVVCTVTALLLLTAPMPQTLPADVVPLFESPGLIASQAGAFSEAPYAVLVQIQDGAFVPLSGAPLVSLALETGLGRLGSALLVPVLALFAFTTVLGWSFYGECAVEFLLGRRGIAPYRALFLLAAVLGATARMEAVWALADLFNALMAWPNLVGVLAQSGPAIRVLRGQRPRAEK